MPTSDLRRTCLWPLSSLGATPCHPLEQAFCEYRPCQKPALLPGTAHLCAHSLARPLSKVCPDRVGLGLWGCYARAGPCSQDGGGGLGQYWSPGSAPPRPWPSDDRSETSEGLGSQGAMQHHRAGKSPWQGSNSLPRGCGICHRETDTEGSSQGCDRCWKGPRTLG